VRLTPEEALLVLDRCERDGISGLNRSVIVYHDGETVHSGPGCLSAKQPTEMTFRDMLAWKENTWCDCGSWRGTRSGQLIAQAAEAYQDLERDATGETFKNWQLISDALARASRPDLTMRREDGAIEALLRRGTEAVFTTARRSAARIGTIGLERAITAQAITATVNPKDAEMFTMWAKRQRLGEHGRELYLGSYERKLSETLDDETRILVAVHPGTEHEGTDPDLWARHPNLPRELALKLWAERVPHRPVLLHERRGVADGLAIIGRLRFTGVATENETDPEVLETLRTIWFDQPENWRGLQDALVAARQLVG
jgi:hypothetical protein